MPQDKQTSHSEETDNEENAHSGPQFPFPLYSAIILICITAVTAVQAYIEIYLPGDPSLEYLIIQPFNQTAEIAGFDKPDFLNKGEYWRLFTGLATHGFVLHVLMNSYVLYNFGKLFEFLSNRSHLPVIFLLSAVGGSLLSLAFLPDGLSVGASGGILGIVSYLAVYAFRRRQFISSAFRKNLVFNIGFIIVFGVALFQYVDNYGHIGGLAVGAIYGVLQIPSDPHIDPRMGSRMTTIVGMASLVFFFIVSAFAIFKILSDVS